MEGDRTPAVGQTVEHHFKGRLPYRLRARSTTLVLDPPRRIEIRVKGDLRGRGAWALSPLPGGRTHVRFDWQVTAERPLLRVLTPALRPLLRWNHAWAVARAREGLEPYAAARAAAERAPAPAPAPAPAG